MQEKEELLEDYIETIQENKNHFNQQLFDIITTNDKYNGTIWIKWNKQQELKFYTSSQSLKVEKIIAPWKWKEIMFLLLFKAIEENLKISLKAEPLRLLNWLNQQEAYSKLINFYWYFLFKLLDNFWNMEFNINKISKNDLKILINRLKNFLKL